MNFFSARPTHEKKFCVRGNMVFILYGLQREINPQGLRVPYTKMIAKEK